MDTSKSGKPNDSAHQEENSDMGQSGRDGLQDDGFVVKVRGLPWSTTEEDIVKFFSECNIKNGKLGVQMTLSREGRPSGEAYIEMETLDDVDLACKRDRDYMGHRYIEVFKANKSEMEWVVERCGHNMEQSRDDACVRLRGLPFDCSTEEIVNFFRGLEVVGNGIILATDNGGRPTGEAYVQFVNKEMAEKALLKHKEKIGHRYIEIFRSSIAEAKLAAGPKMRSGYGGMNQRHAPYDRNERFGGPNRYNNANMSRNNQRNFRGGQGYNDFDDGPWEGNVWDNGPNMRGGGGGGGGGGMMRGGGGGGGGMMRGGGGVGIKPLMASLERGGGGGGGGWMGGPGGPPAPAHCIHMRGLPFRATQADIAEFFRPVMPVNIRILYDNQGRPSGEADVEFACHEDAVKAMTKDKSHIQHRYIELFIDSTPGGGGDRGYGGNNFNNRNMGGTFSRRYNNMGL